jgi:hypothetical protein
MKTLKLLIPAMFLSISAFSQNWEFGSNLMFSQPTGSMKRDMNNAFGITLDVARRFKSPIAIGTEINFSSYGSETTRQQYTFDDGTTTETNVNVHNDIINFHLTGKYFFRNNKNINPYLSGKIGWSFFKTTLTIEDPDDASSCHPLENDVLQKDNTYSITAGAGVRVDFNSLFKNMDQQRFYFDLSVQSIQGGRIQYMNVEHDPAKQPTPDQDVMAKFINTQSQVIHEHHVGYVYTNVLNMVEYRLGIICRPGW